ncbi:plasmid replication-associated protein [Macrococcus carouselicus]|uniref:Plasmid replication-associated protein n=1 Tax=Macrococcus carouselicus TaxID=69969 RepID=A0A9Q8CKL4_9STAP|nr:plasmid replication-associated protein [Macrococcus carouselicus]TDL95505.1 plasmid replication-associated protein [Macrococcus carouselicus]
MSGFLDNIDTSEVKYTPNYGVSKESATIRVRKDIKKRLEQMKVDKDIKIIDIASKVLELYLRE